MSDAVFDRSVLGFEAAALLATLLGCSDADGRVQESTTGLRGASGLTQAGLIRARSELTRHGLLRTEPGFSSNGLRGANVYVLNRVVLEAETPDFPGGESQRNGTEGSREVVLTAVTPLRPASSEDRSARKGLLARLFRRSEGS